MMLQTMTTLVVLSFGLAGAPVGPLGGSGTDILAVEWTSWTAFVESVSTPLALRLGAWLGGTLVLTILLSFVVHPLGRIRAFLGGTFNGVLAAAAFLVAVQRLEEMTAHLFAAGVVVMTTGLMLVRARARARKMGGMAPAPKIKAAPAPAAKIKAAAAPAPTPKPDPTPASKPHPDPALSAPMPSIPPPDTEPVHKLPSAPAPDAKGTKVKRPPPPEPASAPAAEAPSPAPKAALKAKKKPSAPPAKPKATSTSSSGADWLQDHS